MASRCRLSYRLIRISMISHFFDSFSGLDFPHGVRHDQLLELGYVCLPHRWNFEEEEELLSSLLDSYVGLHSSVPRAERMVLPQCQGQLLAQHHHHRRRLMRQPLLLSCRLSTARLAQAPRAELPSVSSRNQSPAATTTGPKLRDDLRENSVRNVN